MSNDIREKDAPQRPGRKFDIQWKPNLIRSEKRLVLTRIYWNHGNPGFGGCSHKLSISLCWAWYDLWVGLFVKPELWGCIVYVALLPCFPLRVHLKRAYGGSFI